LPSANVREPMFQSKTERIKAILNLRLSRLGHPEGRG
jgi:hypothetical protein